MALPIVVITVCPRLLLKIGQYLNSFNNCVAAINRSKTNCSEYKLCQFGEREREFSKLHKDQGLIL
jgi:hypothetical protein